MATKKLKLIKEIDKQVLEVCLSKNLLTSKDILNKPEIDLLSLLDLTFPEVRLLLKTVSEKVSPPMRTVPNVFFIHFVK